MTEPLAPPADLTCRLMTASLSAICALTYRHADPDRDVNPYTRHLDPYHLARLFTFDPSGQQRDNTVADLEGIATIIELSSHRRCHRALWTAAELERLGQPDHADRFRRLANG